MILLLDIGNTHTHLGLANATKVTRMSKMPTTHWADNLAEAPLRDFIKRNKVEAVAACSVVPLATAFARDFFTKVWPLPFFELTHKTTCGVGIDYPRPATIGPDRLANAIAAHESYGAPVVVVDFGTAVTFDVVDKAGNYVGGIIAPGMAALTDYLHEKTALLPKVTIRDTRAVIGKNTEEAMLVGAVHGYRGLIKQLIAEVKGELKHRKLPVIGTGGYAELMARNLPEITAVEPKLTLEGVRLAWEANRG